MWRTEAEGVTQVDIGDGDAQMGLTKEASEGVMWLDQWGSRSGMETGVERAIFGDPCQGYQGQVGDGKTVKNAVARDDSRCGSSGVQFRGGGKQCNRLLNQALSIGINDIKPQRQREGRNATERWMAHTNPGQGGTGRAVFRGDGPGDSKGYPGRVQPDGKGSSSRGAVLLSGPEIRVGPDELGWVGK